MAADFIPHRFRSGTRELLLPEAAHLGTEDCKQLT